MRLLLKVPPEEEVEARFAAKAGYDEKLKCWFLDDLETIYSAENWILVQNVNIICETLYAFIIDRKCWRCGKTTECICLATDKSYNAEEEYELNTNLQLFSLLRDVPTKLKKYLRDSYKYYEDYSKQINDSYIANHCNHCGAFQGDYYLHDLPQTSFYQPLCYSNGLIPTYRKIENHYMVPISAHIPNYDIVSRSAELMLLHMQSEVENWASLGINQHLVNRLLGSSNELDKVFI